MLFTYTIEVTFGYSWAALSLGYLVLARRLSCISSTMALTAQVAKVTEPTTEEPGHF